MGYREEKIQAHLFKRSGVNVLGEHLTRERSKPVISQKIFDSGVRG